MSKCRVYITYGINLIFLLIIFNIDKACAGINFIDQSPTSSEWQNTTTVVCRITVVSDKAIDTNEIEYRISNSGCDYEDWYGWRDNASIDYTYTSEKIRFKIVIPNKEYGNEERLKEGGDNYIQWRLKSEIPYSGMYKINIHINQPPQITILQPDNGEYTGPHPVIEASVFDEGMGINIDSLMITIDKYQGDNVMTITESEHPGIYNSSKGIISYIYRNDPLEIGQRYRITIYVEDVGYAEPKYVEKSVVFTVREDTIVDLVPYPSPFDPHERAVVIRCVLSKDAEMTINIYDTSGKLVKTVIEGQERKAGEQNVEWEGNNYAGQDLANGIYFCEVIAKDEDGEHRKYEALTIFRK